MRSSPPARDIAPEQDGFTTQGDRVETGVTTTDLDQATPGHVIPIPLDSSTSEPLPRAQPAPRRTRELRSRTKLIAKAAQVFEPSDQMHMSVDDDSDTT
jgi:hypothetical protein